MLHELFILHGHLFVTLWKNSAHSLFRSSWRQSFESIQLVKALVGDPRKDLYILWSSFLRALIQYHSFTWKMVLKGQFIGDTGEASAHSLFSLLGEIWVNMHWKGDLSVILGKPLCIHCWGHLGDRTSSQYDSCIWKMVLRRPFVGKHLGSLCAFIVQVSWEMELLSKYDSFTWKMVLKRLTCQWHWGSLYMFNVQISQETELQVHMTIW